MALNLSTLTSPATSGDVLAEALTTADFLEPTPVLRNLSRGSNKGGDAKQDVALNQPKALPLIKNPQGNLGGYLYIPNVSGNYAEGPSVTIGANQTWEGELDMVITQFGNFIQPMGGGFYSTGFGLIFYSNEKVSLMSKAVGGGEGNSDVTVGTPFNVKYGYDGTDVYVDIDGVRKFSNTAPSQAASITHNLQLSQQNNLSYSGNYAIQKAKLTINSSVVFDCDVNGSTSIRHGDTKFQAAVGGPVTINQSGNDPATVIKKSVLRFDGTNDGLNGLFNQTIDGGYMFAAFSVLGDGGASYGNLFSVRKDFQPSGGTGSFTFFRDNLNNNIRLKYNNAGSVVVHQDIFDDTLGDILLESELQSGSQISKVNNANEDNGTTSVSGALSSVKFEISADTSGSTNVSYDLEFFALFPSLTDAQADSVRNYINNRNNVFSLVDGFGYYFFDAQNAPAVPITTGSSSWNGRIVGSDNGDTNRYATQSTTNDAPVGDGFKVTFADNSDHLDIPSISQAGWQVVGTSLGTFAYRVDNDARTELNILGNRGHPTFRKTGDLYGIMLLPESATSADVNAARKLLIDRGAADGATASSLNTYWYDRTDIVEFDSTNMVNAINLSYAWFGCVSLSGLAAIQAPNGNNFSNAWRNCTSLTSFPAGAKLGTSASNVDFTSAWQSSGLTSFPALDLSNGNNFFNAFQGCSSLTTIENGILLGTAVTAANVNFNSAFLGSGISSLPSNFDLSKGNIFYKTFMNCSALTSFPAGAQLGNDATDVNFTQAWRGSGLSSFSTPLLKGKVFDQTWRDCLSLADFAADVFTNWNPTSITSGIFDKAWDGCSALTAQSVENILTSIDASGKYATTNGASGGSALGNAGIDIDYNVATGSLSAATNSAVTSLKSKGWVIVVNGVTL